MTVKVTETERNEMEWWLRHHKGNVKYLATRIKQLVENPDDEEYRKFFYGHFTSSVDEFLRTANHGYEKKGE